MILHPVPVISQLEFAYDPSAPILGRGHFGEVIQVYDRQLRADLAVKRIRKDKFTGDYTDFFREAAIIHASRHPNVMEVKYACQDDENVYIAMPIYTQGTVEGVLRQGPLTMRDVITLALGVLNGLHHIHTQNLIHADIKPNNILISESGQAIVADFGLARYLEPVAGTAEIDLAYRRHAPPEWAEGSLVTSRFDIYQVGMTLYRMLYGLDLPAEIWKAAGENAPDMLKQGTLLPWPELPNVTHRIRSALKKALDPDPDVRFATCLDFANAIGAESELLDWRPSGGDNDLVFTNERDSRQGIVRLFMASDSTWSVESTKKRGSGRSTVRHLSNTGLTRHRATQLARRAMRDLE